MEIWAGIGLFILGAAWVVTSLMCIFGIQREWARAKPPITNYLARNFMPYTFLGFGMACVGVSPFLVFSDPPLFLSAFGALMTLLAVPFILISMIHWPLFLSPPWYRRWYKRGGRMGNKVPLRDTPATPQT